MTMPTGGTVVHTGSCNRRECLIRDADRQPDSPQRSGDPTRARRQCNRRPVRPPARLHNHWQLRFQQRESISGRHPAWLAGTGDRMWQRRAAECRLRWQWCVVTEALQLH